MKLTKKCYNCKESFRTTELIGYTGPRAKNPQFYCPKCLVERQARDEFSDKVCEIFGIKVPGPRIWTERKRLMETYGYTDNIIIDCLDYIYNIKKYNKLAESLCLIKPPLVNEMMNYKRQQENEGSKIARAATTKIETINVNARENNKIRKKGNNLKDYVENE